MLQSFVDRLPPESATRTAARDALGAKALAELIEAQREHLDPDTRPLGPWSHSEMLLAAIHDQLQMVVYAAYHSQGGKPKFPEPMARPGVVPKSHATRRMTAEQMQELQQERDAHRRRQAESATGTKQLTPEEAAALSERIQAAKLAKSIGG